MCRRRGFFEVEAISELYHFAGHPGHYHRCKSQTPTGQPKIGHLYCGEFVGELVPGHLEETGPSLYIIGINLCGGIVYYAMVDGGSFPVIPAIVGATASGKSSLARELADRTGGRIISVDSRKVYRRLDIGSAKPSPELIARYNYAMIDLIEPHDRYSAYVYAQTAARIIQETIAAGTLPILAGGTGFYLRALKDGLFEGPEADPQIRREIIEQAEVEGWDTVYGRLQAVDPETAAGINKNNQTRLVRALEVYYLTGEPLSTLQRTGEYRRPPWRFMLFGIDWPRAQLYDRIDIRTDRMLKLGLFDEVRDLLKAGVTPDAPGLRSVGYTETLEYLAGRVDRGETAEKIKINTRHYAKRQLTWFRRQEQVRWLTPGTKMADQIQHVLV
jgi:tRNA dimethylallyltransferase